MPKVTWEELNEVVHDVKGSLTKASGIEVELGRIKSDVSTALERLKKMKKELVQELDMLHIIILKQIEENNNEKGNSVTYPVDDGNKPSVS